MAETRKNLCAEREQRESEQGAFIGILLSVVGFLLLALCPDARSFMKQPVRLFAELLLSVTTEQNMDLEASSVASASLHLAPSRVTEETPSDSLDFSWVICYLILVFPLLIVGWIYNSGYLAGAQSAREMQREIFLSYRRVI